MAGRTPRQALNEIVRDFEEIEERIEELIEKSKGRKVEALKKKLKRVSTAKAYAIQLCSGRHPAFTS